jgi:tetratricopeptide (TPR) repeat protein
MPPKLTTEKVTIPARDGKSRIAYEVFVDAETGLDVDPQSGEMRTREDTLAMVRSVYDVGADALGNELERYNRWINEDSRNRERERRLFGLPPTSAVGTAVDHGASSGRPSSGVADDSDDDDDATKDAAARAAEFRRQLQEQYYRDVVEKEQQQKVTSGGGSGGGVASTITARAREYRQRGNGWLQQGEHRKALRVYSEGLALFPPPPAGQRCPLLLSNAAQAHLSLELFDEAAALAQEAVRRFGTLAGIELVSSSAMRAAPGLDAAATTQEMKKKHRQTVTLVSQSEHSTCEVLESSSDEDRGGASALPSGGIGAAICRFARRVDQVQLIGLPPAPALLNEASDSPPTSFTVFLDAPFDANHVRLLETPPRPVLCDADACPLSGSNASAVDLVLQPLAAGRGPTLRGHWEKAAFRWVRALEGMGKTAVALACAARIRWALLAQVLVILNESVPMCDIQANEVAAQAAGAIASLGVCALDASDATTAATLIFIGADSTCNGAAAASAAALEVLQRVAPQVAACFTTWTAEMKRLALSLFVPALVPVAPIARHPWDPQFTIVVPPALGTRTGAWPLALPELIWSPSHPDVIALQALVMRHIDSVLDEWKLTGKCGPAPAAAFGAGGIAASILRISGLLLEPASDTSKGGTQKQQAAPAAAGAKLAETFVVSGARRAEAITGQQPWLAGVLDAARAASGDDARKSAIDLLQACADEIKWSEWPYAVAALRFARSSVFFFVATEAVRRLVSDVLDTAFGQGASQEDDDRKLLMTIVGQAVWARLETSMSASSAAAIEGAARKTLQEFVWNSDRGAHLVFALTQFAHCAALTAALQASTQHVDATAIAGDSTPTASMFLWADAALGSAEATTVPAPDLGHAATPPPCVIGHLASPDVLAAWAAQLPFLTTGLSPAAATAPRPETHAAAVWGPLDSSAACHAIPVLTLHPALAVRQRWSGGIVHAQVPTRHFLIRSLAMIAAERRAASFGAL